MTKTSIAFIFSIFLTTTAWASHSQDPADDSLVRDPRIEADYDVFVVDEQEWGLDIQELTDTELFGTDGLIEQMLEYEATASRKHGKGVKRHGPKAQRRSCVAPRSGGASYYADAFHGKKTANGERFNMNALTAASKTIAFNSLVRVTYKGKSVVVRINDAGPYSGGRVIDLSKAAAAKIGMIRSGHGNVTLSIVRCGRLS